MAAVYYRDPGARDVGTEGLRGKKVEIIDAASVEANCKYRPTRGGKMDAVGNAEAIARSPACCR
jgi:hypothetical protein